MFRLNKSPLKNYPSIIGGVTDDLPDHLAIKKNRGAIKPVQHKDKILDRAPGAITTKHYFIPTTNANGEKTKLCVKPGDHVLAGQPINLPRNDRERMSLAGTSGKIIAMKKVLIGSRVSYYSDCLILEADGKNEMHEAYSSTESANPDSPQAQPAQSKSNNEYKNSANSERTSNEHNGLDATGDVSQDVFQDVSGDVFGGSHKWTEEQIIQRIKRAAIYGMGGGGFPAWRKLSGSRISHIIVNAVECEPYITADNCLIENYTDEIVSAIEILQNLVEMKNSEDNIKLETHIAIEDNMPRAISLLKQSLSTHPLKNTYIRELPTAYPAGSEKQLISSLLGKEVPAGQVSVQQGILCFNVSTIRAIYHAIIHNQPLLQRLTTLAGDAIAEPRNYWITTGTPIRAIIEQLKLPEDIDIFLGGGMMNYKVEDIDTPLGPSNNCVLFFRKIAASPNNGNGNSRHLSNGNGSKDGNPASNYRETSALSFYKAAKNSTLTLDGRIREHKECIRCGVCADVCPVNLLPQELYRYIKADKYELAYENNVEACIECAACDYVCPSNIPLSEYYVFTKEKIKADNQSKDKADRARDRFNNHKDRIELQKKEREAKRQARMAAMKNTNQESPAQDIDIKIRKISSLKMQIQKTEEAIKRWQGEAEEQKVLSLKSALAKLQQELQELQ